MVTCIDFMRTERQDNGDVSILLDQVKAGNRTSVEPLFKLYIQRTIALAASPLQQKQFNGYAVDIAMADWSSVG